MARIARNIWRTTGASETTKLLAYSLCTALWGSLRAFFLGPVAMRTLPLMITLALSAPAFAAEGMWQPAQLPGLADQVKAAGLELDPALLSDLTKYPMNAVIGLGFCTASFVSPKGLVVTNHHCAYGSIQFNSTAESNLLQNGFVAATFADEKRAEPSMRVWVTEGISDVTPQVLDGLADDGGRTRFDAIDQRMKSIVAGCESDGFRCDVYVFHGGARFNLVKQMEIKDVRLVYAPAEAIGKFGGDVDNWIWPRHTGDFAFYRAYVSPDGKPNAYNEANVPFQPKAYLRVSNQGVDDGDYVMVAGYPGRTNRYRISDEIDTAITRTYPDGIARLKGLIDIISRETEGRPDAAVKYASTMASLNNGMKNFEGNRDGFARIDAVGIKRAEEAQILSWAEKDSPGAAAAHRALQEIAQRSAALADRNTWVGLITGSSLLSTANTLYRINIERSKSSDAERERGFQQRDEPFIEGRLKQFDQRYDPAVHRAIMAFAVENYLKLPAAQRIAEIDAWLGNGSEISEASINKALDDLQNSALSQESERLRLLSAGKDAIEASDDPALRLAVRLYPATLRMEDETKTLAGDEYVARPAWMEARLAYADAKKIPIYPDANSSLRVTFGNVVDIAPRDAVHNAAITTDRGILEKHTGVDPFDATEKQVALLRERKFGPYADANGNLPVNFLSDLDITGGNSGSPVMNKRGELVGLAFDGNYESISSGWIYNKSLTRMIAVDARYMLWTMDAVDNADHLIKEMGLKPTIE